MEKLKELARFERLKEEQRAMRVAVKERMTAAITGAFGIVAGLAWNDAVRATIDYFYPPQEGGGIWPKFLYAIIITIVVAILIYVISKVLSAEKKQ